MVGVETAQRTRIRALFNGRSNSTTNLHTLKRGIRRIHAESLGVARHAGEAQAIEQAAYSRPRHCAKRSAS